MQYKPLTSNKATSDVSVAGISSGNVAHSSLYGLRMLYHSASNECTRFSGFKIARAQSNGVITMLKAKKIIYDSLDIQDSTIGIYTVSYRWGF